MFSSEYCEIFKSNVFTEYLRMLLLLKKKEDDKVDLKSSRSVALLKIYKETISEVSEATIWTTTLK